VTYGIKRPKPNPLPAPRPKDSTRGKPQKIDRSQWSPEIPKKKPKPKKSGPMRMLGKLAPKHDPRTPYLTEFLVRHKLPAPTPFGWGKKLSSPLGMLGNDVAGNCTCAGIVHMLQVQAAAAGKPVPSIEQLTKTAMELYKAITLAVNGRAYDPNDPSTDTGLALLDVLNYCRKAGFIGAFVKLHHNDVAEIEAGGMAFGGLYTGAQLPTDAKDQLDDKQIWTPTSGAGGEPGGWGGHAMYLANGDGKTVDYATWGQFQTADYGWVTKYADEMYVTIDSTWVDGSRPAPSGFDIDKLRNYLAAL